MAGDEGGMKMGDYGKNKNVQYMCAHTVHCTQRRAHVLLEKRRI